MSDYSLAFSRLWKTLITAEWNEKVWMKGVTERTDGHTFLFSLSLSLTHNINTICKSNDVVIIDSFGRSICVFNVKASLYSLLSSTTQHSER